MICELIIGTMMLTQVKCQPPEFHKTKSEYQIRVEQQRLEELERKRKEQASRIIRGASFTGNGTPKIIGTSYEQCVIYARRVTGNTKISGYAGNLKPEGYEPVVGSAVLEYGHVSVLIAKQGDMLVLHDANYIKGAITERVVHKSSVRGYIY